MITELEKKLTTNSNLSRKLEPSSFLQAGYASQVRVLSIDSYDVSITYALGLLCIELSTILHSCC